MIRGGVPPWANRSDGDGDGDGDGYGSAKKDDRDVTVVEPLIAVARLQLLKRHHE